MNRSDLIDAIAETFKQLPKGDVDLVVRSLLEQMSEALANGERIEIRGFGSFTLHYKPPCQGRNPKSGEPVAVAGRYHPHFKPGKELRERVCPPMPTS